MKHILTAFIFFLLLLGSSCNHTDEPEQVGGQLSLQFANVTDASLHLAWDGKYRNTPYLLMQDGRTIATGTMTGSDTILYADSLLPHRGYGFRAYVLSDDGGLQDSSNMLTVTTMDTTSNDITWTLDTLGEGNASMLNDVFILNDTCAFAVGALYYKDDSGNFVGNPFNLLVWNGKVWQKRRAYPILHGKQIPIPITGVFAFSDYDIWLVGSFPIHGDGYNWNIWHLQDMGLPVTLEKAWGRSSKDMYFVGGLGSLVHYDGTTFTQLQTNTQMDIQDIYGAQNSATGMWEVMAIGGNSYIGPERKIFKVVGETITELSTNGIDWSLSTLWFVPGRQYWMVGDGIWSKAHSLQSPTWNGGPNVYTHYVSNRVRGNDINDVFFCGAFGDIVHFNGLTMKDYQGKTRIGDGSFHSIAVKGNLIIAVGDDNPRAILATGIRR